MAIRLQMGYQRAKMASLNFAARARVSALSHENKRLLPQRCLILSVFIMFIMPRLTPKLGTLLLSALSSRL